MRVGGVYLTLRETIDCIAHINSFGVRRPKQGCYLEFCNRAATVLTQPNLHFSVVMDIITLEHAHFEGLKPVQWDGNDMMTTLLSLALHITFIFLVWLLWSSKMSNTFSVR